MGSGSSFVLKCSAVVIEIFPNSHIDTFTSSVHVSCSPSPRANGSSPEIVLLELLKDQQDTVALVRQGCEVNYGSRKQNELQAVGCVDKDPALSYLNVTLTYPDKKSEGRYTCVLYYLNDHNLLKEERDSMNLTWSDPDEQKEGTLLRELTRKLSALEQNVANMGNNGQGDLVKRVEQLEAITRNQSNVLNTLTHEVGDFYQRLNATLYATSRHNELMGSAGTQGDDKQDVAMANEIIGLDARIAQSERFYQESQRNISAVEDKVTTLENSVILMENSANHNGSSCAFSARRSSDGHAPQGLPIVFDRLLLDECRGFNTSTGTFTAPRRGLYAFYLAIRLDKTQGSVLVSLKTQTNVIAQLYVGDQTEADQTSVNVVVKLDAGEEVRAVPTESKNSNLVLLGKTYTTFSGYLLL